MQEDEDGHLVVLQIIQDLMEKAQDAFLDHFARLGVFSKVLALVGPRESQDPIVTAVKGEVNCLFLKSCKYICQRKRNLSFTNFTILFS